QFPILTSGFFREAQVGFLEGFLGTDIEPEAGHTPHVDRGAWVQPLDESPGLVRVVPFGDVLSDEREGFARIVVKGDAGDRAGRLLWFLLEESDPAGGVEGDGVVFLDVLQAADIVDSQDWFGFALAELAELSQGFAEQIVS